MKSKMLLFTIIISFYSFKCWTQKTNITTNEKKTEELHNDSAAAKGKNKNTGRKIKYYHVEEITPLKFGGFKTIYDVTDPKFIRTYDLGPNNKRTITPVYEDDVQPEIAVPTLKADTLKKIQPSAAISISDKAKKKETFAYIDIIKTYERVSDKGYESIDMLKKVGDNYFFNDELEKAEKIYEKLFSLTTELQPEYYYRYSISLRAVGKTEKADELFKKFNQLSNK